MEQRTRSREWKRWVVGFLVGLLMGWPGLGWGQKNGFYKSEIRALFKDGKALAEKKNYQGARAKFFAALALLKRLKSREKTGEEKTSFKASEANFFYFLGRVYALDRQREVAIRYYRRCVEHMPKSRAAKVCRKELKALEAKPALRRRVQENSKDGSRLLFEGASGQPSAKPSPEEGPLPSSLAPTVRPAFPAPTTKAKPPSWQGTAETVFEWRGSEWQRPHPPSSPSPAKNVAISKPSLAQGSQGVVGLPNKRNRLQPPEDRLKVASPSWALVTGWTLVAVGLLAAGGAIAIVIAQQPLLGSYNEMLGKASTDPEEARALNHKITGLAHGGWVAFGVAVVSVGVASFAFVKARPSGLPPTTKAGVHVQGGKTILFERW